ncbi:hypothetical protein BT96DRAFT_1004527 [Gymnopus androsaceus JB14]|uniref:Uncharacterized protein n=1 Tax=Gymnopus androsaceus JB14 TaxID=1447944 RepID=A0A6A4GRY4_9AGAR|nr:hypothetical protein BT96DRAFT_1004527 [Gymnopus androsaceus JB14]
MSDTNETMVDYDSDITSTSDNLGKPDHELLLRLLRDAEERNRSLLAQAIALKELNEALEKEVDRLKVNYNQLDDECADLWWERLMKTQENFVHHRKSSPDSTSANFGFNAKAYLDSINHAVERQPLTGSFIAVKEKIHSKEEKFELRVKRVLLAKDVLDGKGYGRQERDPSIGYFNIDDINTAQTLIV